MNMDVVAEGVETGHQLETLAALGCSRAQGYYFSKPVGADAAGSLFGKEPMGRDIACLERTLSPGKNLHAPETAPEGELMLTAAGADSDFA